MRKGLIVGIAFLGHGVSQDWPDALRWSLSYPYTTSRAHGMAGAISALGTDLVNAHINPGGLAFYERGDLAWSMQLLLKNSSASYLNQSISTPSANINFRNGGVVFSFETGYAPLTSWFFGLVLTSMNNFNTSVTLNGTNTENSVLDDFIQRIQEKGISNVDALLNTPEFATNVILAWNTYLIDSIQSNGGPTQFKDTIRINNITQDINFTTKGHKTDFSIPFGVRFGDVLGIGGAVSIITMRFSSTVIHKEIVNPDPQLTGADLKEFSWQRDLVSNGQGIQLRFGIMGKLNEYIRIGGYIHSPLWASLTDEWAAKMESQFNNGDKYTDKTDPSFRREYGYNGPVSIGGQLGVSFPVAIIGIDYTWTPHNTASFSSSTYSFTNENRNINEMLTGSHTLKAGVEGTIGDFRLRGGYYYQTSPLSSKAPYSMDRMGFFGGAGYVIENFRIEMSLGYESYKYRILPYRGAPVANVKTGIFSLLLTMGVRF